MDQVGTDNASTVDFLNVVYDISADPSSFQTLSGAFEQWVWPKIEDADNTNLQHSFASHFERAEGILARISATLPDARLSETIGQSYAPSNTSVLLLNDQLTIISG